MTNNSTGSIEVTLTRDEASGLLYTSPVPLKCFYCKKVHHRPFQFLLAELDRAEEGQTRGSTAKLLECRRCCKITPFVAYMRWDWTIMAGTTFEGATAQQVEEVVAEIIGDSKERDLLKKALSQQWQN